MKKTFLVLAVSAMVSYAALPVLGQGQSPERQTPEEANVAEFTETRGQLLRNRCSTLETRVGQIASEIEEKRTPWVQRVSQLVSKIGEFSNEAESAGIDVTQLRADLAELSNLSGQHSAAWQDFIDALKGISTAASCDENVPDVENLHDKIEAAKTAKAELRQSIGALIDFFQTTIKADLAEIREQITGPDQG